MGYLRHEAIIVNDWDSKAVLTAHAAATTIFNERGMGGLVSGLVHHAINRGASFFIAPDGSKEGWAESKNGDEARAEFMALLPKFKVEWAHVLVGGDDGEYAVLKSAGSEP